MVKHRSLGGIGRLYQGEVALGDVYYNIKREQPPGSLECTLVFIGKEMELPSDGKRYRLVLEDGHSMTITLRKGRAKPNAPYIGTSCDGVVHFQSSYQN